MSYICLISNGKSAVVAGDTRKNFIALHSNNSKKVFSSPDGQAIWACCGLMHLGLKDCAGFAEMVLSQPERTIENKLEHIARYVAPLLKKYKRITGRVQGFTVLYAQKSADGILSYQLNVSCEKHSIQKYTHSVFLQSGSGTKHFTQPIAPDNCPDLVYVAARRVAQAIQSDTALSDFSCRQTVGGHIRVKILK